MAPERARADARALVLSVALASLCAACSNPAGPPDVADASDVTDGAPFDAPPVDAITDARADSADARTDVPFDARDTAPPDDVAADDVPAADVVIDTGMCGASVRMCFCRCGANAACQQACVAASLDCSTCIYETAAFCCPGEDMRLGDCIVRFDCMDDACVAANCPTEQAAFNACFAREQTSSTACQARVRTCLGSDYPMVRCAM